MVELVVAFGDDLVVVDPDVTFAGENIDVRSGFPVGVSLRTVGVAEGEVNAGEFFVLEQNANHFGEAEVGAKGKFADAVGIFVGVAVIPEFISQVFTIAIHAGEAGVFDGKGHGGGLQVAVLAVEVIAGRGVADKSAVDGGRGGEDFASGKIGPVARGDEAAGFDPVEAAVEMSGKGSPGFGFDGKSFSAKHAFAEFVAEAVH